MSSPGLKQSKRQLLRNAFHVSHRGKEASKFQFDISIERIYGATSSTYVIRWTRGVKNVTTQPFRGDPKDKQGVHLGEKLSLVCTLYREKGDNYKFDSKDAKISLVSQKDGKTCDKTVGKVHFDLSQFAGVPSKTTEHTFQLNAKTKLDIRVTAIFIGNSQGTASSVGTGVSGLTGSSGELEPEEDDEDVSLTSKDVGNPSRLTSTPPISPKDAEPSLSRPPSLPDGENSKLQFGGLLTPDVEKIASGQSSPGEATSPSKPPNPSMSKKLSSFKRTIERNIHSKLRVESLTAKNEKSETSGGSVSPDAIDAMFKQSLLDVESKLKDSEASFATERQHFLERIKELNALNEKQSSDACAATNLLESRISSLNTQIATLERSKVRIESENQTLKQQILDNPSSAIQSENTSTPMGRESKHFAEISLWQERANTANSKIADQENVISGLEEKCDILARDSSQLKASLKAHEDHAAQIKETFDQLSGMYENLRQDHAKTQSELRDLIEENNVAQNSERSRFKRLLKGEKKSHGSISGKDESLEDLHVDLNNLKNLAEETNLKLIESEKKRLDAEKNVTFLTEELRGSNAKYNHAAMEIKKLNEMVDCAKADCLIYEEKVNEQQQHTKALELKCADIEQKCQRSALVAQHENADLTTKLHEAETARDKCTASIGHMKTEIERLQNIVTQFSLNEKQLQGEIKAKQSTIEMLEHMQESREAEIDTFKLQIPSQEVSQRISSLERTVEETSQKNSEQQQHINDLNKQIASYANRSRNISFAEHVQLEPNTNSLRKEYPERVHAEVECTSKRLAENKEIASEGRSNNSGTETDKTASSSRDKKSALLHTDKDFNASSTNGQNRGSDNANNSVLLPDRNMQGNEVGQCTGLALGRQGSRKYRDGRERTKGDTQFEYSDKVADSKSNLDSDPAWRPAYERDSSMKSSDSFLSSGHVRRENLLEKITDARILDMLVETKMKLAIAEEEKLALEHLLRRIRNNDRHVQRKLMEHANKLELKLSQASFALDAMQTNCRDEESPHSALRYFSRSPENIDTPKSGSFGSLSWGQGFINLPFFAKSEAGS